MVRAGGVSSVVALQQGTAPPPQGRHPTVDEAGVRDALECAVAIARGSQGRRVALQSGATAAAAIALRVGEHVF